MSRRLSYPDEQSRIDHYNSVASSILRIVYVMTTFAAYFGYAAALSDALIIRNSEIAIPLINQRAAFDQFVIISQIIILGFHSVLLLYVRQLHRIDNGMLHYSTVAPYFFSFHTTLSYFTGHVITYWFGPLILALLAAKALPHPIGVYATVLVGLGCIETCAAYVDRYRGKWQARLGLILGTLVLIYLIFLPLYFGFPPDNRVVYLPGEDFAETRLSRFRISNSNFREAKFINARIRCTNLEHANLVDASFDGAVIYRSNFSGALLLQAQFKNTSLLKTNFSGATMRLADLSEATVTGPTKLTRDEVRNRRDLFEDLTDEGRASPLTPECQEKWMEEQLSSRAKIGGIQGVSPSISEYYEAYRFFEQGPNDFQFANFMDTDFQRATLRKANLIGSNFRGANFAFADLEGANLNGSDLRHVVFACANLKSTIIRGTDLTGADFCGADLTGADLCNSVLTDVLYLTKTQILSTACVPNEVLSHAGSSVCKGGIPPEVICNERSD